VLAVFNAFYLYAINSLLLAPGLVARALGVSAIGLPTLLTLYATPETALMQVERLIALCLLILPTLLIARRLTAANPDVRAARWGRPPELESTAR
jgi:hypothetical protein